MSKLVSGVSSTQKKANVERHRAALQRWASRGLGEEWAERTALAAYIMKNIDPRDGENLRFKGRNFRITSDSYRHLTSLPQNLIIEGSASIDTPRLKSLPDNFVVYGNLKLSNLGHLSSLGSRSHIGGDIYLDRCSALKVIPDWLAEMGPSHPAGETPRIRTIAITRHSISPQDIKGFLSVLKEVDQDHNIRLDIGWSRFDRAWSNDTYGYEFREAQEERTERGKELRRGLYDQRIPSVSSKTLFSLKTDDIKTIFSLRGPDASADARALQKFVFATDRTKSSEEEPGFKNFVVIGDISFSDFRSVEALSRITFLGNVSLIDSEVKEIGSKVRFGGNLYAQDSKLTRINDDCAVARHIDLRNTKALTRLPAAWLVSGQTSLGEMRDVDLRGAALLSSVVSKYTAFGPSGWHLHVDQALPSDHFAKCLQLPTIATIEATRQAVYG